MDYPDIYFVIASISTIAVAGLLVLGLMYIVSILYDIKRLSKIAKKEAEIIARSFEKGAGFFGSELSNETVGFVRTVFALLLSQVAGGKRSRAKKSKVQNG